MSIFHAAQFKTKDGKVTVFDDGSVGVPKRARVIPPADILDIVVEDGEAASRRVTVGRVLAIGVFALAAKKKVNATKFLIVETVDDAFVVELDIKRYSEARSFAAKAMSIVRKGQAVAAEKAAQEDAEAAPAEELQPSVTVEPGKRRWWQKTTGELINERRALKGKKPLNFDS